MASHFHKGIILAGGSGSRLEPLTRGTSKQLLPIYDKPMVYYPLSVLMVAGIREFLIISTPHDIGGFRRLFGDGNQLGCNMTYAIQQRPAGLAQAFVIGREFIGDDSCALALGDNLLYGPNLPCILQPALERRVGATIFGYRVTNPRRYGVVEFDDHGRVLSLEEKPARPRSSFAIPGLYFYDNAVIDIAANLKPSSRGELEITEVNQAYLERSHLYVELLSADLTWMDAGTTESLFQAADFVRETQLRTGMKIACLEEIAFRKRFIDAEQLQSIASSHRNEYGDYLWNVLRRDEGISVQLGSGRLAA